MGIVEFQDSLLILQSHIFTYGNAANPEITEQIRREIEDMWNAPLGEVPYGGKTHRLQFKITASYVAEMDPVEILANDNPLNNYFRIEEFAQGHISFVDGLGCNTGYFLLENLYPGSTTAAHEYGHTLGLKHPQNLDLRGRGVPGIMYPRGTLVDAAYQYDPQKPAGVTGGTMHPMYRSVSQEDIQLLEIDRLEFNNGIAVIGDFSSVWHPDHQSLV